MKLFISSIFISVLASPALFAVDVVREIRRDTSPPLSKLIEIWEAKREAGQLPLPTDNGTYIVPNILKNPDEAKRNRATDHIQQTRGVASPVVDMSFDGYSAADNITLFGGTSLPPDTNGDIGPDNYIIYVNTGWSIYDKTTGLLATDGGPFPGNSFWAGFGGPCEADNAGDPIVLYDKLADRWMFSQFTSSANPDGHQCFAISTTNDPRGPYHRYQFDFPGEFNDYPHIGIWNDASGEQSGYYFVTHDFQLPALDAFFQASFLAVERDEMLQGNSAQVVRMLNTASQDGIVSSFGAQPPHLESVELPPVGMCAPFVLTRTDLGGYSFRDFCVDWANPANSTLSTDRFVDANALWSVGINNISQVSGSGNTLDSLVSSGRVMYRASYRAFPAESGLPVQMALNHSVAVNSGQAAIRWVQIQFPLGDSLFDGGFEQFSPRPNANNTIINQGVYSPDTDNRWMGAPSIDKDGNLAVGYSVASTSTFASTRYAARKFEDPVNTIRDEAECVAGGGVQGSTSGRWGDYSSMSIDPDDQCTFWLSNEYYAVDSNAGWENRICSFKFADCGDPNFTAINLDYPSIGVCSDQGIPEFQFRVGALNGFSGTVTPVVTNLPAGTSAVFSAGSISSFPSDVSVAIENLGAITGGSYPLTLELNDGVTTRQLSYEIILSDSIPTGAANLISPVNTAVNVDLAPVFNWASVVGALDYRIEIATDSGFTNVVVSTSTNSLTFTAPVLSTSTEYYWRIIAENNCGNAVASSVFSFTTGSLVTGTTAECPGGTSPNVSFFDNLEGDVSAWTMPAGVGANTWALSSSRQFSGTNAFFAQDVPISSDQYLVSPSITIPDASQQPLSLAFWNYQSLEANAGTGAMACWDGALLEISTDGGATFTQIADSLLLRDNYNGMITNNANSPISDLEAWCATSAVPVTGVQSDIVVVNLNDFAGSTVQFRFRVGTDSAVGDEGWYIDEVTVQGCQ